MPHTKRYHVPKVKKSKSIQLLTSIWLVPFIAMIIALWLAYQYYAKIGPTIHLHFKENAGLVANQSQIKLRNVTIGMVTKISLSADGKGVVVQAKMNKEVSNYLNHKAKFWIVHADVGSHGVSGLDTLISGSYIELHGVKEKKTQKTFIGLDKPYIDKEAKGAYYLLSAPSSYNITEGSTVYYRMIKVGRVERVALAPNGKKVNFTIFVQDNCTPFINLKSQFYTNSSVNIDITKGKLDLNIASISQLVHGAISIYTPTQTIIHKQNNLKIPSGHLFPLYKSISQMKSKHLVTGKGDKIYTFIFDDNITNLEVGSPIEFNGFQVGYVTDIESHFTNKHKIKSQIYALLYTDAFANKKIKGEEVIKNLVEAGLKAQLDQTIPLIGSQFINLIFNKQDSVVSIDNQETFPLFPTIIKTKSSSIMRDSQQLIVKLQKLTTKLTQLPLDKLLNTANDLVEENRKPIQDLLESFKQSVLNLNNTITNLNDTISDFHPTIDNINALTSQESLQALPDEVIYTLQELTRTLEKVKLLTDDYSGDSKFAAELSLALQELTLTAESMGRISLKLEKKPNALLLGDD